MFGKSVITWTLATLALTQLAAAQPHNRRGLLRRHPHPDPVAIARGGAKTVYVDQYGNPLGANSPRTITVTVYATRPGSNPKTVTTSCKSRSRKKLKPSSAAPPPPPAHTNRPPVEPVRPVQPSPEAPRPPQPATSKKPEPVQPKPEPVKPQPATSKAPKQTSPASPSRSYTPGTYPSGNRPGIVYSPYNSDHSCKSAEQVAADVEQLKMFSPLRLYGVDCNQVQNVLAAAKKHGIQIFAGIWNVDKAAQELETLIKAVDGQWDMVHTIAVGNEVVNFGRMSATEFASIINSSRKRLQQPEVGYYGPVVGVDTFVAIMGNPAICEASDYVAANCHSFFDGGVTAEDSGKFLDNMKAQMAKGCGDKKIVITEVGWPTKGSPNGKAVPGVAEQQAAIKSIMETQKNDVVLFTAFDDKWKQDTALTFGTEQFWGIQDKDQLY